MPWTKEVGHHQPRNPDLCHALQVTVLATFGLAGRGVGSVWTCSTCGAEYVVVSDGPDGPRRLEKRRRS